MTNYPTPSAPIDSDDWDLQRMIAEVGWGIRLSKLGIRVPSVIVCEVVQRIRNGESLYALYNPTNGIPLVAKGTAEKIKRLLGQGKLDFMSENSYART